VKQDTSAALLEATEPYRMRKACSCGEEFGTVRTVGNQDTVRCARCNVFQYNAPRVETGRAVRTVSTVHEAIKPKLRARILERATGRCELCGADGRAAGGLHVGHLISVKDGLERGLTEVDLNTEENLAAMCAECNLGLGQQTVPLRLAVAIVMTRLKNQQGSK
jgi:5-methylcytosine-specific restriction endonuclease McrA